MEDEEELVKVYSYLVNEEELIRLDKENKEITNDDIERLGIQDVLKENGIFYKNKLVDYWNGRDYKIMVEVYVYDIDAGRAKKAIEDFAKEYERKEFNYDDLEGYEGYDEEEDENFLIDNEEKD